MAKRTGPACLPSLAPLLHLRCLGPSGIFANFAEHFEAIWRTTQPRGSDGEIRQEFSLCFYCSIVGGEVQVSEESYEVGFFSPQEIEHLNMHPSIRLRIEHYLEHRSQPVIN